MKLPDVLRPFVVDEDLDSITLSIKEPLAHRGLERGMYLVLLVPSAWVLGPVLAGLLAAAVAYGLEAAHLAAVNIPMVLYYLTPVAAVLAPLLTAWVWLAPAGLLDLTIRGQLVTLSTRIFTLEAPLADITVEIDGWQATFSSGTHVLTAKLDPELAQSIAAMFEAARADGGTVDDVPDALRELHPGALRAVASGAMRSGEEP